MTGPVVEIARAYRLVLDPTAAQQEQLRRHAGACRWAYNWALAAKMAAHRAYTQELAWLTYTTHAQMEPKAALDAARRELRGDPRFRIPGYMTLASRFTQERGDEQAGIAGVAPWWRSVNRYAITSGFQNADTAWRTWLDSVTGKRAGARIGYPRFKKRGRCTDGFALFHDVKRPSIRVEDARHLRLPTIGTIRLLSAARRLLAKLRRGAVVIKSARVSRRGHRWIVALTVVETIPAPATTKRQRAGGPVGVDLGVSNLAALSTGELVANPRGARKDAGRIAKLQRAIARCQPGSQNRARLVAQLGRVKTLQAERRRQTLHQLTKRLATSHSVIVIEDLNVAGMTRSASGTLEKPGRNVRAKAGLNREILDVGFGEFRRQFAYKTVWYGSRLQIVDRYLPSSKTCSRCGHLHSRLSLRDRVYSCPACGFSIDRDLNAALNLRAAVGDTIHPLSDPAKPTPAAGGTSTTPDTCDRRDPEAKIGTPGERPPAFELSAAQTREDPPHGGPHSPSNRRGLLSPLAHHP